MRYLLFLIMFVLAGCSSAPKEYVVQTRQITEFVHKPVTPVAIPEAIMADVQEYKDANGKVWALFDPDELYKIEQAYISAERNAELVEQLNMVMELTVQRANLIRELALLEEHRAIKMEMALDSEREDRKADQLRNSIESISLKILAGLAIAVAL